MTAVQAVDKYLSTVYYEYSGPDLEWARWIAEGLDEIYGKQVTWAKLDDDHRGGRMAPLTLLLFRLEGKEGELALQMNFSKREISLRRAMDKARVVGKKTSTSYHDVGEWLKEAIETDLNRSVVSTTIKFVDYDDRDFFSSCSLL